MGREWQTAMSTTIATFQASILRSKIKGYVQSFERDVSLQVSLFFEPQFECLFRTPYDQRVLHIDATGNLVKVNGQGFKRIFSQCQSKYIISSEFLKFEKIFKYFSISILIFKLI